jgi:hypothetical protein
MFAALTDAFGLRFKGLHEAALLIDEIHDTANFDLSVRIEQGMVHLLTLSWRCQCPADIRPPLFDLEIG